LPLRKGCVVGGPGSGKRVCKKKKYARTKLNTQIWGGGNPRNSTVNWENMGSPSTALMAKKTTTYHLTSHVDPDGGIYNRKRK